MSHNQFQKALSEALILEYEHSVPQMEPHAFSPRFEKQMRTLIRRREKPYYRMINTAGKRAACFAAALLMLSTVSVLKVDAFRSAFQDFTVKFRSVFSTFQSADPEKAPETIEEIYEMTYDFAGNGYELLDERYTDQFRVVTYTKGNESVTFQQCTKKAFNPSINTEDAEYYEKKMNGVDAIFYRDNLGIYYLIWDDGDYALFLLGETDKETFIEIADSIQKIE